MGGYAVDVTEAGARVMEDFCLARERGRERFEAVSVSMELQSLSTPSAILSVR